MIVVFKFILIVKSWSKNKQSKQGAEVPGKAERQNYSSISFKSRCDDVIMLESQRTRIVHSINLDQNRWGNPHKPHRT